MKAVTWQGKRDVSVDDVPDPQIQEPTDAIIRVTTTNICGSDLHLYETLGTFMDAGDILGHEPMGIVEEVGAEVTALKPGDRVVIPFQISCGTATCASEHLYTQCETTQVREQGTGAALFGFSKLYGEVPGGQAEYLRVPQAQFTHIKVPDGPARRPLRLPLRRPAHRLAGRRVRRDPAGRHGRRARPRTRSATWPAASRCTAAHRRSSASTSSRSGSSARAPRGVEVIDLDEHDDDVADVVREIDRRPRPGLGHRRRRHGGARLARSPSSPSRSPGCCPTRSPSR